MKQGLERPCPSLSCSVQFCGSIILVSVIVFLFKLCPVVSLEEALCVGTGYYLPGRNISENSLLGYKSSGWDRFFDKEVDWASVFWVADHRPSSQNQSEDSVHVKIRMLADHTGSTMVGWLALEIFRHAPFQFLVIWAITQRNEAYGQFLFDKDLTLDNCLPYLKYKHAYVNCSAVPFASEVVPNLIISANINVTEDSEGNVLWAKIPSSKNQKAFSVVWHASPTHCFKPEKFRFMIATSSVNPWNSIVNWTAKSPFQTIEEALQYGPIISGTPWIEPSLFAITSFREPGQSLVCTKKIKASSILSDEWIVAVNDSEIDSSWFEKRWNSGTEENVEVVKKRSTCKGAANGTTGFVGRCTKQVDPENPSFVYGDQSTELECPGKKSRHKRQTVSYTTYLEELYQRVSADCECPVRTARRKRAIETDSESEDTLFQDSDSYGRSGFSGAQGRQNPATTTPKPIHYLCIQAGLTPEQQTFAGMCVYSDPGKLVFGVRQWHGLTSLVASLIITPLSVLIARYHKGFYMMKDGRLPLRTWYLIHILLIFPSVWMHASGFAALSRQREVLGLSLTKAAAVHRAVGCVALSLMGIQIITGFLRPRSMKLRKLGIFVHWFFGYLQHGLEVFLCIYSNQIPGSPTNAHSILNEEKFGDPVHSASTELFLAWICFSVAVHIFQMVHIKLQDRKLGIHGRSVFPVIVPVLTMSESESENLTKVAWIDKAVLIIYLLVSGIIFFVVSVSMYQVFYDKWFYGFGPMSCSHKSATQLLDQSNPGCS